MMVMASCELVMATAASATAVPSVHSRKRVGSCHVNTFHHHTLTTFLFTNAKTPPNPTPRTLLAKALFRNPKAIHNETKRPRTEESKPQLARKNGIDRHSNSEESENRGQGTSGERFSAPLALPDPPEPVPSLSRTSTGPHQTYPEPHPNVERSSRLSERL